MHILAFFVFMNWIPALIIIIPVIATMIYLGYKKPFVGMMIALFEAAIGGHGILISDSLFGQGLSLRIAIFLGFFIGYACNIILNRKKVQIDFNRFLPFLSLMIIVGLASVNGYLLGNGAGAVFDDANGYLWFLYAIPMLTIQWTSEKRAGLLQMVFAAVIWLSSTTLILSYAFTHIDGDTLDILYRFVRDSRLAEITLQVTNQPGIVKNILSIFIGNESYWFRIFQPSQLWIILFGFLLISSHFFIGKKSDCGCFADSWIIVISAALITSLSRSFLVAFIFGLILGLFYLLKFTDRNWREFFILSLKTAGYALLGILIAIIIAVMPIPGRPDLQDAAFYQTAADTGRSEAVISRWNLLDRLHEHIFDSPIIGSGMGSAVSYISEDPRIIESEGGEYTTYRFEWGYHDIWLKMGIAGLAVYAWIFFAIMKGLLLRIKESESKWIPIGLSLAIIAVFTSHIFSPFLNHPIGISMLLFTIPFIGNHLVPGRVVEQGQKTTRLRVNNLKMTNASTIVNKME